MLVEEKIKLFNDVFAPKNGEKILILIDIPHNDIKDTKKWSDRREMAQDWFNIFNKMGEEKGFSVDWKEFEATGIHNTPIPAEIVNEVKNSNLVIAMTEYSASSSLLLVRKTVEPQAVPLLFLVTISPLALLVVSLKNNTGLPLSSTVITDL